MSEPSKIRYKCCKDAVNHRCATWSARLADALGYRSPVATSTSLPSDEGSRHPTPPPPSVEALRVLEEEARETLEANRCPPCYPPDTGYPLQDPHEDYREIIQFWEGPSRQETALCAQRQDWLRFLCQVTAHGRPTQYTQSMLWDMFWEYHRRARKKKDQEIAHLRRGQGRPPEWADHYQERIESAQRWCARHDVLMRWIEKQRPSMAAQHGPSTARTDGNHGDDQDVVAAVRRRSETAVAAAITKQGLSKPRATLGDQGVSKSKHQPRKRHFKTSQSRNGASKSTQMSLDKLPATPFSAEPPAHPRQCERRTTRGQQNRQKGAKQSPPGTTRQRGVSKAPRNPESAACVTTRGRETRKPVRWMIDEW